MSGILPNIKVQPFFLVMSDLSKEKIICSPVISVSGLLFQILLKVTVELSHLHACAKTNRQYFTQMYLQASRLNETYCLLLKVYNSEL